MAKITSHKGQLGVEVSDAVHDQNYKSQHAAAVAVVSSVCEVNYSNSFSCHSVTWEKRGEMTAY